MFKENKVSELGDKLLMECYELIGPLSIKFNCISHQEEYEKILCIESEILGILNGLRDKSREELRRLWQLLEYVELKAWKHHSPQAARRLGSLLSELDKFFPNDWLAKLCHDCLKADHGLGDCENGHKPDNKKIYTCDGCVVEPSCSLAWDRWNTQGDCLMEK